MEDLLQLQKVGTDTFVAVQQPWLPPAAPSIYGGTMISQCILAAEATMPDQRMRLASLHCTFIEGGKPQPPIYYAVQRTNTHTVRRVRAVQDLKCIFIAMLRFEPRSQPYPAPPPKFASLSTPTCVKGGGDAEGCPFVCSNLDTKSGSSSCPPQDVRILQQMKTRQRMATDDRKTHAAAVAYMSDNYFLPTVTRVHGICWERDPERLPASLSARQKKDDSTNVKMMVSLDHSMYFAETQDDWRADHWLLVEMQSHWAGDGRGLVMQKIFSDSGHLICTAVQEGVVRLEDPSIRGPRL